MSSPSLKELQQQIDQMAAELAANQATYEQKLMEFKEKRTFYDNDLNLSKGTQAVLKGYFRNYLMAVGALIVLIFSIIGYFGGNSWIDNIAINLKREIGKEIGKDVEDDQARVQAAFNDTFDFITVNLKEQANQVIQDIKSTQEDTSTNLSENEIKNLIDQKIMKLNTLITEQIEDALSQEIKVKPVDLTNADRIKLDSKKFDWEVLSIQNDPVKFDKACDYLLAHYYKGKKGINEPIRYYPLHYIDSTSTEQQLIFHLRGSRTYNIDAFRVTQNLELLELFSDRQRRDPIEVFKRCYD